MRVRYFTKHIISGAIVFLLLLSLIPFQVGHASSPETYYSGAADGYIEVGGDSIKSWATVHHATSGDYMANITTPIIAESFESSEGTSYNAILRSFLPFDTSGLPDTATITAATLNIYIIGTVDEDNDGYDYLSVVQTTQASATSLVLGDYDQCGAIQSPQKGAADIDITSISASAYLTFTLNATGIAWISLTGWTQLGIREGHDVADHQIAANKDCDVTFSSSEVSGTSQDPFLTITYTVPSGVWHDVSSWTASLVTRMWSSGTPWTFSLITGIWSSGLLWTFDVVTSIWTDIATWSINLSTMMWNDVATWVFYPLTMMWRDISWLFSLTPPQWLNVAVWTFSLLGDIDLISFALCFLALAFAVYPLVTGEEKALPALALVMAIMGCALSVLGLWYALAVAALSFILSIAALATRKD